MYLQFGDDLLEDDKLMSEYAINYHSHVSLIYDNPNIVVTVKHLSTSSEITVDYNSPVETLLSSFLEVYVLRIAMISRQILPFNLLWKRT